MRVIMELQHVAPKKGCGQWAVVILSPADHCVCNIWPAFVLPLTAQCLCGQTSLSWATHAGGRPATFSSNGLPYIMASHLRSKGSSSNESQPTSLNIDSFGIISTTDSTIQNRWCYQHIWMAIMWCRAKSILLLSFWGDLNPNVPPTGYKVVLAPYKIHFWQQFLIYCKF